MKIAVLSDIHGNLPALKAVSAHIESWQPDLVVVNGDIINRGPLSGRCLRFVRQKHENDGWHLLRGNHEEFVLDCAPPNAHCEGPEFEIRRFAYWAYEQIKEDVDLLVAMPDRFNWIAPDGSEFRVTHASMRSNREGIFPHMDDEKTILQKIAPAPAVFVTAHTHRPFIEQVDGTLVVNVGAAGAPFDEDPRPSYGQFTWTPTGWQVEIARVVYDRSQTERDYVESGFLEEGGPLVQLMLVELRRARGMIFRWITRYQERVLSGEISLEESVRDMLCDKDVRPFVGPPGWSCRPISANGA